MDQCPPRLVLVDPLRHRVKVLVQRGMRLILEWDVEDLQSFQGRIGHVLQAGGVDDEGDVPAGQHSKVQG